MTRATRDSGDHCVLICDKDAPRWKNSVGLTPANARKLAAALNRMADQSEHPNTDAITTTVLTDAHRGEVADRG